MGRERYGGEPQVIRWACDVWERAWWRFAYSPYSSLVIWLYGLVWAVVERGNIGFDGFLTLVGIELVFSLARWENRKGA